MKNELTFFEPERVNRGNLLRGLSGLEIWSLMTGGVVASYTQIFRDIQMRDAWHRRSKMWTPNHRPKQNYPNSEARDAVHRYSVVFDWCLKSHTLPKAELPWLLGASLWELPLAARAGRFLRRNSWFDHKRVRNEHAIGGHSAKRTGSAYLPRIGLSTYSRGFPRIFLKIDEV